MKQLLHERLKEYAEYTHSLVCDDIIKIVGLECKGQSCAACGRELFDHLIDEIERYYVPRPRDNKGIPFIEGETVWYIDPDIGYSASAKVVEFNGDRLYVCWEDDCTYDWVDAYDMQHEPLPPVLDANGTPIKIGCIPYGAVSGRKRAMIESVHHAGEKNKYGDVINEPFICYVESCGNGKEWDFARNIVIEPPDSLEKLRDDMYSKFRTMGVSIENLMVESWINRLSALIERDA